MTMVAHVLISLSSAGMASVTASGRARGGYHKVRAPTVGTLGGRLCALLIVAVDGSAWQPKPDNLG